ncbi:GNAT family N-acetyltransferase [Uliginosibacterium sp. 31-16]|uniref:GNAT family N-acetyltransferase n=1 Tax=Uliginosibacterium sp. 31-16 TaxID=3068315 RepID=UPI00273D8ADF|nr:GNAT family N-acetyltransferase [Uliginosibacterium sp. 31-16]MDP5237912.1 GNAT family N-acetyltransferase [Uliginosibacterium sp. 31-16]
MGEHVPLSLVDICNEAGEVAEPAWLARAEKVHRQLRPALPADYTAKMRRVFAGGARMTLATRGDAVCGLAVWRWHENTFDGIKFYIDDLVTDAALRSQGVGKSLVARLAMEAHQHGADALVLDSGTQRQQAHRFYFREGFVITSFNFKKQFV